MCLYLWLRLYGQISDFGLNAFTETLGIIVTVLIVDQLIRRQEQVRLLPQQATAYEDVRLLISRMVSFWSETFKLSVPGPAPGNYKRKTRIRPQFFSLKQAQWVSMPVNNRPPG